MNQPVQTQSDEFPPTGSERRVINQGDVFWVQLADQTESESGIPHPYVVVQDNLFNHSRVNTVIACALTSNLKRSSYAGNVLLNADEANLPKPSIVEVSKLTTLDKSQLGGYIGSLSQDRIDEILAGIRFQQLSFFNR